MSNNNNNNNNKNCRYYYYYYYYYYYFVGSNPLVICFPGFLVKDYRGLRLYFVYAL
jgi:hypothetical protein